METMEIQKSPEQENVLNVGDKLNKLLVGYGNPKNSRQHAALAEDIRSAVRNRNLEELLEKLEWFGNARCNDSLKTQEIEMFCSREANDIIDELKKLENIPWDDLLASLEISKREK